METTALTWHEELDTIFILWLENAAGDRYGYVRHHARSTAKTPTYIGVVLASPTRREAQQVTRTFGGEPTIEAAQAAVIAAL